MPIVQFYLERRLVHRYGLHQFKILVYICFHDFAGSGYWSMKYHSVYSNNIDLNLRTSTLSSPLSIDGFTWLGCLQIYPPLFLKITIITWIIDLHAAMALM